MFRYTTPLFFMLLLVATPSQADFIWPKGAKAAVSLAYDDGLNSQLDNALPVLNHYDFKATFYLTLNSPVVTARLAEWRSAAKQGHELGNHSINHPCDAALPGRRWVAAHNDLAQWSVAAITQEIQNANGFLFAIDGRSARTFTPPCGDSQAKNGDYIEQVAPMFVAIRRPGDPVTEIQQLESDNTPTWFPVNPSLSELKEYVQYAARQGALASINFHGVGGDYLSVSDSVHQQFLSWLDDNRETYWVDNFLTISRYIQQQQKQQQ